MNLDSMFEELSFFKGGYYQKLVVLINGKEYVITDVYPDCDPVVEEGNPDLREECNHRIVFEAE